MSVRGPDCSRLDEGQRDGVPMLRTVSRPGNIHDTNGDASVGEFPHPVQSPERGPAVGGARRARAMPMNFSARLWAALGSLR